MEISIRLNSILALMDKCYTIADIGTDHGYIPICAVKQGLCQYAIASDINHGPLEKAERNIQKEGLKDNIECRRGAGLETVGKMEADAVIIAGMGGNLIRDIIEKDIDKAGALKYLLLQPAQNPEVLREFLYKGSFTIIKEELCFDENKYYEIFKVKPSTVKEPKKLGSIGRLLKQYGLEYEISEAMVEERHPLILNYIEHRMDNYKKILRFIQNDSASALNRIEALNSKLKGLEEIKIWLLH